MKPDLLDMSVSLVTAHLAQNRVSADDVPDFIRSIYMTLMDLHGQTLQLQSASAFAVAAGEGAESGEGHSGLKGLPVATQQFAPEPREGSSNPGAVLEEGTNRGGDGANRIAYARDNDLGDPVFRELSPWLAARVSPRIASKLDPNNEIHPSVFPDHLICLEDGQKVTLLRPYLANRFGLAPAEYMAKWNLPDNYPMAPPLYIERKRKLALEGGLGRKVRAKREKSEKKIGGHASDDVQAIASKKQLAAEPKRRGRPPKKIPK